MDDQTQGFGMKYKMVVDFHTDRAQYMVSPAILFRPPQKSSDRITTIGIDFSWWIWWFCVEIRLIEPKDHSDA